MIDGWLFSFSLNPNPTPGMAQMVAKALSGATGSQRARGNLALGALIHRTCRANPKECARHQAVKDALKVRVETPIITSYNRRTVVGNPRTEFFLNSVI